jgi:hypothetical protein
MIFVFPTIVASLIVLAQAQKLVLVGTQEPTCKPHYADISSISATAPRYWQTTFRNDDTVSRLSVVASYGVAEIGQASGIAVSNCADGQMLVRYFTWGNDADFEVPCNQGQEMTVTVFHDRQTVELNANGVKYGQKVLPLMPHTMTSKNFCIGSDTNGEQRFFGVVHSAVVFSGPAASITAP